MNAPDFVDQRTQSVDGNFLGTERAGCAARRARFFQSIFRRFRSDFFQTTFVRFSVD
jgi:hypothetical protein